MRPIPLNMQTVYADLLQSKALGDGETGSISVRKIKGRSYLYVTSTGGGKRRQRSIGRADDPEAIAEAEEIQQATERERANKTAVAALKKARMPSPSVPLGKVLKAVADAGLFESGVALIGTAAYQTYPGLTGAYLPSSALMTNDADLLVSSFISKEEPKDLEKILQNADPSFRAVMNNEDKLPKVFRSKNNFQVDVLTKFGRGRTSPVEIDGLQCSAEALKFMEYLAQESVEAVVLYGAGVLVSVPPPIRYAIHKLLIAQERRSNPVKRNKDLKQSKDLMDALLEIDADAFEDALSKARRRGPAWRQNIDASLAEIKRMPRQGARTRGATRK